MRGTRIVTCTALGAGIGLGAGLMYMLDPDRGRRRRALAFDQFVHALHEIDDAVGVLSRDLANRSWGMWSGLTSLSGRLTGETVPDEILVERVRSKLGRYVSHPRSLAVDVSDGRIRLSGPILSHEVEGLLKAVASMPGVTELENGLEIHDRPGNVSGLQGGRERLGERAELCQSNWSPTARLLVGSVGATSLLAGACGQGAARLVLGTLGVGLIARAVANIPARSILGADGSHSRAQSEAGPIEAAPRPAGHVPVRVPGA